jgi:lipopolysaccharide export system permease protein
VTLLDRYLAKEILLPFVAGVLFLTQLLLATQLLSQAEVLFGSGVSLGDIAAILVSLMPHILGYVLPIAFLLGAVLGVGRLAEDRELMALAAAGVSPARLVRVPLGIGIAVGVVGLWLSLSLEPAGLAAARARINDVVKRNVTNDVRAGTFYDQIPGYTLYAEKVRRGGWEHVLISDRTDPASPVLALAGTGRLEPVGSGEEMQLVLRGGELHREDAESDEYVTADFRNATLLVGLGTALTDKSVLLRGVREMTVGQMRQHIDEAHAKGDRPDALRWEGYLNRRIAQPLAVLPFALLAFPLGASRRAGRAFAVGATLLAVVAHYVLLRGGEVLAQRDALPPVLALQLPTIVLSVLGLALIAVQARRGIGAVR